MNRRLPGILLLLAVAGAINAGAALAQNAVTETQAAAASQPAATGIAWQVQTDDGTTVARLDNGLTAIVKAVRTAPVVCVRAYVHTGSLYEKEWLGCGLSHLCEHLVAKEAVHQMPGAGEQPAKQPAGDDIGGQSNAYTNYDQTCYYISAAAGKTMQCIDMIAGEMTSPDITAEDFKREHGVVTRELEMGMDSPGRVFDYANMANIFGQHPAAVPVIGFKAPLSKLTFDDVKAYLAQMYVPQNMIFVVVGDIDSKAVLARIVERFAAFPAGRQPTLELPAVQPFSGVRRVVLPNKTVKDVTEELSFQTIPLLHEDLYALDVLSNILSEGRSSRLVRKLQFEKSLVTTISASSWTPAWAKGAFAVSFRAEPDKADLAEQAVMEELKAIATGGVSDEELAKAKRQKAAELVYSQQTVESISAMLAGDMLSTGNIGFMKQYTERVQKVTAEHVRAAAAKYFTFDRMAITRMVPAAQFAAGQSAAGAQAESKATMFTLPNGLRVVLSPSTAVGLVAVTFAAKGGLLLEDANTNGLGMMMASLSTRGAGTQSGDDIAAFFDEAGGSVSAYCGNNGFNWKMSVLDDRFDSALPIFADIIQRPTFPQKELDAMRPMFKASVRRIDENWQSQLMKYFRGTFFTGTPYAMMPQGSEAVLDAATVEQLTAWHQQNIKAGSSVLVIYGKFDAAATKVKIEQLFSSLPKGEVKLPAIAAVPATTGTHVLKTKNVQAGVVVAVPGMTITDLQDRFPIDVLDTIISGYQLPSGWLHDELRGKQLVYVVHAYNWPGVTMPGAFIAYAGCQPDNASQVVQIIEKNFRKASEYTPSQKEIDRAVNVILTAELLDSQELSDLATSAASNELYGMGYDFRDKLEQNYRKVTPEDVLRVGKKYLGGGMTVVVTSPEPFATATSASQPASSESKE